MSHTWRLSVSLYSYVWFYCIYYCAWVMYYTFHAYISDFTQSHLPLIKSCNKFFCWTVDMKPLRNQLTICCYQRLGWLCSSSVYRGTVKSCRVTEHFLGPKWRSPAPGISFYSHRLKPAISSNNSFYDGFQTSDYKEQSLRRAADIHFHRG